MPKALSLDVGVSNSNGHAGPLGTAFGCTAAAVTLQTIAEDLGFARTELLCDERANLQDVVRAFETLTAAGTLDDGDLFVLTLAGHGKELAGPGHGCEPHDQALVLYDDYLVDDDLYQLCKAVTARANIVIVAEGCYTGSIHTNPVGFARREKHRLARRSDADDAEGRLAPCPERPLVDSSVLVLAATSATSLATAVLTGGLPPFTRALVDKLSKSADYRTLRKEINKALPHGHDPCVLNEDLLNPPDALALKTPFVP